MKQKKEKKVGIRLKLIAVIIPIVFVIIVCFFALSRNMITKLSKEKLEAESLVYTGQISSWVNQIFAELQVYKDTIEQAGFPSDKEILDYMRTTVEKNAAYPVGLYMGDDAGVYLDASDWVPGPDWILTERDWYVEGKDNDELAFGEPYYDSQTGDVCVSATVRMKYPKATRVLATDIFLDYVSGLVTDISEKDIGKAFLVTKESQTIIAHPDQTMMDTVLSTEGLDRLYKGVGAALAEGKTGLLSIDGDAGEYFVCINAIPRTNWQLVTYISSKDVLAGLRQLEPSPAPTAAAAALVLIFTTMHLMNKVVKPVERVTDVIQKVAEGDFTQNIEVRGHDEIARMSNNMQVFLVQMRETISNIMHTADWLNQQSEEHGRISGSLTDSAKEQADAMKDMAAMVQELSEEAEAFSGQMQQLVQGIEDADEKGKQAVAMMFDTVQASENGKEAADHVSQGMEQIEKSITSLAEQISHADAMMEQIGAMVNLIMDVAEETNLLSLNASIEAARAGDAGRGFAVVAEQIGKLAENSGTAADDIAKLTSEIQATMKQLTARMQESVSQVTDSTQMVEQTGSSFATVFEKVGGAKEAVGRMTELVDEVRNVAVHMEEIAERQAKVAEEIAESTHRLDDSTKIVGSDSVLVAESANELEKESRELMDRMNRFQV